MSITPPPHNPVPPGSGSSQNIPPGQNRFAPRPTLPTMHPRKVRGGAKITSKSGPVSLAWSAQRWMRLVEELAPNELLAQGIEYARLGQTKILLMPQPPGSPTAGSAAGHISARVQGRLTTAYTVDIRLPVFNFDQWEKVIVTMMSEVKHVASLLAGEVPPSIEDVFRPHALKLFPQEASDLAVSCTCKAANAANRAAAAAAGVMPPPARPGAPAPAASTMHPDTQYCKHVCCVMAIIAEKLGQDPFLVFGLRGLWKDDLLERLRQKRALAANTRAGAAAALIPGASPMVERALHAISPRIPGVTDFHAPAIHDNLDAFWLSRPAPPELDLALKAPEVSHPLLRRLGPSPFIGAKFPLVGLLATCYDVISTQAMQQPEAAAPATHTPSDAPIESPDSMP